MHLLLLRALQAVCLLLGTLVLRSCWFIVRLLLARYKYNKLKVPGPPLPKLLLGRVAEP